MASSGVLSLNDRAKLVAEEIIGRAGDLDAGVTLVHGARVIDAGVKRRGTLTLGLMVARACLADLGVASLTHGLIAAGTADEVMLPHVAVAVDYPVAGCMASQYAGWKLQTNDFFAMGSGPMRASFGREELYNTIDMREKPTCAVGVLECDALPTESVVRQIAGGCDVSPVNVTLIAAKTASVVGGVQVVARSVETAIHKLHEIKFPIRRIVGGYGTAPLPPIAKDSLAAIGRTNDAILYGGRVTLMVRGDDASLQEAGAKLPASTSADYGDPFIEIFKRADGDFYKIDPLLFSPAAVVLQNVDTGNAFHFGRVNHDVLMRSFFSA